MKDANLRTYQKDQLKFLKSINGTIRALESPTGTGKSIVILQYVKECLEENKYKTIVITTGFNELVFQMKEDAKNIFDIDATVLIGAGHIIPNCENGNKIEFSREYVGLCTNCKYKKEKYKPSNCTKRNITNFLNSGSTKVIITNHSYFLCMKNMINADLVIVDEAHTFSTFYESNNVIAFSEDEKKIVNNYMNNVHSPISSIFNLAVKRGEVNPQIIKNAVSEISRTDPTLIDSDSISLIELENKLVNIFKKKSIDSFVESDGKNFSKTMFFTSYDLSTDSINPDIIITSATLDEYTLKMFKANNRNQIYRQRIPSDRYKGSNFVCSYVDFRDSFEDILNTYYKDMDSGLVLCTTNDNVDWAYDIISKKFKDFKVFKKSKDFKAYDGKKILVGSKMFFQGVNIPDLNFVILDKIPFEVYDNKYKAYSYYIEKTMRVNAWKEYTLPLVKNNILQSIGRLWRKNDIDNNIYDQGSVCICDSRFKKRFSYIRDFVVKSKPGIELIEYGKDEK